jgi:DNA invertase Pin-like site-specific DNA recombinase
MTKCAIWARVSDSHQDTETQLRELRLWAANRGLEVVAEYILDGKSAYKGAQVADLDVALNDARLGKYQILLTWALDRLSREGVEATLSLLRRFHERGVSVWSHKEGWTETSDPHMAELLASLFAWMAHQESVRRSERIKAGNARRKALGLPVGRQSGAIDKRKRSKEGYKGNANWRGKPEDV